VPLEMNEGTPWGQGYNKSTWLQCRISPIKRSFNVGVERANMMVEFCPGIITEQLHSDKKVNVYLPSLMIEVPDHVYVFFCFLTASMSVSAILVTRCAFKTIL
jgi:hypothetical protein